MNRIEVKTDFSLFPEVLHPWLKDCKLYDSSCSPEARVYYIEKDGGFYLKAAPKGTLKTEAEMTDYFHQKGLAPEIVTYLSLEKDWMLSERVHGEDCTFATYRDDPKRLVDTLGSLLRSLHETDYRDCPVPNRTADYLNTADTNYKKGMVDPELFTPDIQFPTADSAWKYLEENKKYLKTDTLLHGDYCLPNIMLDDWRFSGFIDVGNGGVGDRHIDLFWGAWTLWFNLKTNAYRERFFDAYGRDKLEPELLRVISAAEVFG